MRWKNSESRYEVLGTHGPSLENQESRTMAQGEDDASFAKDGP